MIAVSRCHHSGLSPQFPCTLLQTTSPNWQGLLLSGIVYSRGCECLWPWMENSSTPSVLFFFFFLLALIANTGAPPLATIKQFRKEHQRYSPCCHWVPQPLSDLLYEKYEHVFMLSLLTCPTVLSHSTPGGQTVFLSFLVPTPPVTPATPWPTFFLTVVCRIFLPSQHYLSQLLSILLLICCLVASCVSAYLAEWPTNGKVF